MSSKGAITEPGRWTDPVMSMPCRRSDTIRMGEKGPKISNQVPKKWTFNTGVVRPVTRPRKKRDAGMLRNWCVNTNSTAAIGTVGG